jgi:ATP-dependent exoDNAse (exonuclease V) alpha subunit
LGDAIGADAQTVATKVHRFQPDMATIEAPPTGKLWIVDEAGMASAKDKADLLARAAAEDARVILVGDDHQIGSVGAGAAFAQIKAAHRDDTYELTDIKRQTSAQLRDAVYAAIRGDATTALDKVDVREHKSQTVAAEAVADDYMKHVAEGKSTLVVTLSRADRAEVNAAIQARRERAGEVTNVRSVDTLSEKGWTDAQKADASRYQPGDVIEAQRDFRDGPKRGELATVTKVEDGKVTTERSNGREWAFDPSRTNRYSVLDKNEARMGEGDRVVAKGAISASDAKGEAVQIKNGTEMAVDRMHNDGRMDVRYGDDKRATIDASQGVRADLGYAQTANQAQGKTVDVVIADMRSTQRKLADQQRMYVALSRAKETAIVHTDDKEKLAEQIERHSGRKETAMDRAGGREVRPGRGAERDAEPQGTKRNQERNADLAERDRGSRNLPSPEQRRGRVAQSGEGRRGIRGAIADGIRAAAQEVGKSIKDYGDRAPERQAAKAEKRDAEFLRKGAKKANRDIDKRTRKAEKRIQKAYGTNPKAGRIAQFFETGRKAKGRKAMKKVQAGRDRAKANLAAAIQRAQARQTHREFERAFKAQQQRNAPVRERSGPHFG